MSFGLTDDFQEFNFMFPNHAEDYEHECQEISEESQKNCPQESEQAMSEDDVSINLNHLVVSSVSSNNRDNVQIMKDVLAQTLQVFEEIETNHQEDIIQLNSDLKNLKNQQLESKAQSSEMISNLELELENLRNEKSELKRQYQRLKEENMKLLTERNEMKFAMKQLVSNFSE